MTKRKSDRMVSRVTPGFSFCSFSACCTRPALFYYERIVPVFTLLNSALSHDCYLSSRYLSCPDCHEYEKKRLRQLRERED